MIKLIVFIGILLASTFANADLVTSVGIGKGVMKGNGTPFERALAIGWEHPFITGFFVRPEAGWFMDNSGEGLSSPWASTLGGVRATSPMGATMHLAVGPAYLHNPDQKLGGHFQFSLEGGVGIEDKNFAIAMVWKHLSSAGINMPNQGRDFIMAQIRIPFGRGI